MSVIMERLELGKYVVSDPAICHGKLTFKGTRVVESVLAMFINSLDILKLETEFLGKTRFLCIIKFNL